MVAVPLVKKNTLKLIFRGVTLFVPGQFLEKILTLLTMCVFIFRRCGCYRASLKVIQEQS